MGLRFYRRSRRKLRKFLHEFFLADEISSKTTAICSRKNSTTKPKYMKKLLTLTSVLCAVATLAFVTGCASTATTTAAPSKNAGRLTIRRAANFGDRLVLNVSIDGAQAASLVEGRSYHGTL